MATDYKVLDLYMVKEIEDAPGVAVSEIIHGRYHWIYFFFHASRGVTTKQIILGSQKAQKTQSIDLHRLIFSHCDPCVVVGTFLVRPSTFIELNVRVVQSLEKAN